MVELLYKCINFRLSYNFRSRYKHFFFFIFWNNNIFYNLCHFLERSPLNFASYGILDKTVAEQLRRPLLFIWKFFSFSCGKGLISIGQTLLPFSNSEENTQLFSFRLYLSLLFTGGSRLYDIFWDSSCTCLNWFILAGCLVSDGQTMASECSCW